MNSNYTSEYIVSVEDRFNAVTVAYNQASLKYEVAKIDFKVGPEVINTREIYMRHKKEYEEAKENLIKVQDYLYSQKIKKSNSSKKY